MATPWQADYQGTARPCELCGDYLAEDIAVVRQTCGGTFKLWELCPACDEEADRKEAAGESPWAYTMRAR